MPKSIDAMADKMVANMKEKTGKTLQQWLTIVKKVGLTKHMEIVKFLKAEHSVTHGFANMVAHHALNPVSSDGDGDLQGNWAFGVARAERHIGIASLPIAFQRIARY